MDAPAYAQVSSAPNPSPGRRWGRLLLAGALGWAVLLAAVTWLSVREDRPTVREQRNLAQAAPVVDRTAGALLAATGPDVVAELMPAQLDRGCRVTPFLDGAVLKRRVTVRTGEADAEALLTLIAERLPADYRAGVRRTDEGIRLRADAGEFVAVRGRQPGPGLIELLVDTGCRPVPDDFGSGDPAGPDQAVEQELGRVLTALGRPAPDVPGWVTVPCPGGRPGGTASAAGPGTPPGPPGAALRPLPAGAAVVVDTPEVYAYRSGPLGVTVALTGEQTRVSVTRACG